ncbi:hypothetical protein ABE354_15755 [Brevibacillus laterosporus]|uniref:hypothetical protein n=1 Tax=Brevibacillus laterosporus TaxID=1465 RepID=UPI003D1F3B0C
MKKSIFVALSLSIFTSSLYFAVPISAHTSNITQATNKLNLPNETAEKIHEIMESEDAKLLFKGLDDYKQYYSVGNKGYYFTDKARENIPTETYALMEDTFRQANKLIKERVISDKPSNELSPSAIPPEHEDSTKYQGKSKQTYIYDNPNWDVGLWFYANDDDTRAVVDVLIVATGVTAVASVILSLFMGPLPAASSALCSAIAGTAASLVSNKNKGNGVIFRVYSGGFMMKSR